MNFVYGVEDIRTHLLVKFGGISMDGSLGTRMPICGAMAGRDSREEQRQPGGVVRRFGGRGGRGEGLVL